MQSTLTMTSLNCSTYTFDGCNGGFPTTAYDYVARAGGITTEAKYPYDISTSFCDRSKNDFAVTVVMSYRVIGEEAMISQVLAGRTLSVAVDANFWGPYQSGIFSGCSVDYNVNHAVNIVGVNVNEGYWIVRNSWGDWWGDNGYMKLAMVRNATQRTFPNYHATFLQVFPYAKRLICFFLSLPVRYVFFYLIMPTPVTNFRDQTCAESTTGPHTQTPPQ